jgi:CPA1 family monovalent cation:H+ antiporter
VPGWKVATQPGEPAPTCSHLGSAGDPEPPAELVCVDCVAEGTSWVHLRQCLSCGGVRCCDSSPRRHATAHFAATGHPLMRSAQPGEDWGWCYPDELLLAPGDA